MSRDSQAQIYFVVKMRIEFSSSCKIKLNFNKWQHLLALLLRLPCGFVANGEIIRDYK